MKKYFIFCLSLVFCLSLTPLSAQYTRQMEYLNRGLVAVKVSSGVYLSWRLLATDDPATAFNIYRNDYKINGNPFSTSTFFADTGGSLSSTYRVVPVLNGVEQESSESILPWPQQYKSLQLQRPPAGKTPPNQIGSVGKTPDNSYPDGQDYTYTPNDMSVGDLDGDGEYELLVKWYPSNAQDNSYYGITGNVYLDAYKLDGTFLWRIDLGKNIRAGAHYTQFMVYDLDGDGRAELVCKTAPGTIDGEGNYVLMNADDPNADYRNLTYTATSGSGMLGVVINGPEYLTLFDGMTGAELHTIAYNPPRGTVSSWGDNYGNRVDRHLAAVAYLNGETPSVVMCRGYYTRSTLVAYDVHDKKLVQRWYHNSATAGVGAYGQGFHSLSVADVDGDGKDEIIYGAATINDDGTLLYRTGVGHGDAMHVSDMDPDRPGLEVWTVHEDKSAAYGYQLFDARTGQNIWGAQTGTDVGRGMAGDIDASYRGFETWSSAGSALFDLKGNVISTKRPSVNFRIYWDGDLQDELLDGVKLDKWNGNGTTRLITFSSYQNSKEINSTKANPCLSADLFGDWREEVICYNSADPSKINIFTTILPTQHRIYTLMHDPVYRLGIAWQNVAYNQPPHLGFYIGDGVDSIPWPSIETPRYVPGSGTSVSDVSMPFVNAYLQDGTLNIHAAELIRSVAVFNATGSLISFADGLDTSNYQQKIHTNNTLLIIRVNTDSGIATHKIMCP